MYRYESCFIIFQVVGYKSPCFTWLLKYIQKEQLLSLSCTLERFDLLLLTEWEEQVITVALSRCLHLFAPFHMIKTWHEDKLIINMWEVSATSRGEKGKRGALSCFVCLQNTFTFMLPFIFSTDCEGRQRAAFRNEGKPERNHQRVTGNCKYFFPPIVWYYRLYPHSTEKVVIADAHDLLIMY